MKLTLLQPSPTHMERTLFGDEVSKARVLACAHYDDCLDQAVMRSWLGWNCTRCPLRTPEIAEPDAFPAEEVVKEVVKQRRDQMDPNGPAMRVWALFSQRDAWHLNAIANSAGLTYQQSRDACRTLARHDRIAPIGGGVFERVK